MLLCVYIYTFMRRYYIQDEHAYEEHKVCQNKHLRSSIHVATDKICPGSFVAFLSNGFLQSSNYSICWTETTKTSALLLGVLNMET